MFIPGRGRRWREVLFGGVPVPDDKKNSLGSLRRSYSRRLKTEVLPKMPTRPVSDVHRSLWGPPVHPKTDSTPRRPRLVSGVLRRSEIPVVRGEPLGSRGG